MLNTGWEPLLLLTIANATLAYIGLTVSKFRGVNFWCSYRNNSADLLQTVPIFRFLLECTVTLSVTSDSGWK